MKNPNNAPTLKLFLLYAVSSTLLKSSSLLLLPVVMRMLTPIQMGLFALINSAIALMNAIISCGLRQVFSIEYYHKNSVERKALLQDIICIFIPLSSAILLLLYTQYTRINIHIFTNQLSRPLYTIMLTLCALSFFTELFFQILTYQKRATRLISIQISAAIITATGTLLALLHFKAGIFGIFIAQIIGLLSICVWIGCAYYQQNLWQHLNIDRTLKVFPHYLQIGAPFVLTVIAAWITTSSNRWMLASLSNLQAVGLYSVVEMIGTAFQVFILYPVSGSYIPHVFEKFAQKKDCAEHLLVVDQWNLKNMWTTITLLSSLVFVGYFTIGKYLLLHILPAAYHVIIPGMPLMACAQIFLLGTYFATCRLHFLKKTNFLASAFTATALVNLGLNYLFIPIWGVIGSLKAYTIANAFYFIIILTGNYFLRAPMLHAKNYTIL